MSQLTMSRYALALQCSYPFRPDVHCEERPPGKEAQIGSIVHAMAEADVSGQDPARVSKKHELYEEAWSIFSGPFRAWLGSQMWHGVEWGLLYDSNTDTAERGPRRGEPGYETTPPGMMRGTLDLLRRREDIIDVVDIKTGKTQYAHPEQLYAQAVAVHRTHTMLRPKAIRVGFVFARKTKVIEPEWEVLDADRLDAEAGRLAKTLKRLPVAEPNPGDWCAYRCPLGRANCPAWATQDERIAI